MMNRGPPSRYDAPRFGKQHGTAMRKTSGTEIERLIGLLARLPGLGPRSARKAALSLLKRRADLLEPLAAAMTEAAAKIVECANCGELMRPHHVCEACGCYRKREGVAKAANG